MAFYLILFLMEFFLLQSHLLLSSQQRWLYSFLKAFYLYYDGFKQMTLGKTLWLIILIKLFVIFAVLKLFFFPDFIGTRVKNGDKATFVNSQLERRMPKKAR